MSKKLPIAFDTSVDYCSRLCPGQVYLSVDRVHYFMILERPALGRLYFTGDVPCYRLNDADGTNKFTSSAFLINTYAKLQQ